MEITVERLAVPVRLALSPDEAALAIGMSRAFIYQMIASGRLDSIKINRSRRITIAALQKFIDEQAAADPGMR